MIVEAALGQRARAGQYLLRPSRSRSAQLAERIADEYGRRDLLRFGARPDNLADPPGRRRRPRLSARLWPSAWLIPVNHCPVGHWAGAARCRKPA